MYIECYRNNKIVLRFKVVILNEKTLINMLKEGVVYYDTGYPSGDTEIIYLKSFDKVVIKDHLFFYKLSRYELNEQIEEIEEKDKEIERLNNIINEAIKYMNNTYGIKNIKDLFYHYNKVEKILEEYEKE